MDLARLFMTLLVAMLFGQTVYGKQSVPRFLDNLGSSLNIKVKGGENIKLLCQGSGRPRPRTHWTKDGENIYRSSKYFISKHFMLIRSITVEDAGKYKCEIKNHRGSISRTFILDISGNAATQTPIKPVENSMAITELKNEVEKLKMKLSNLPRNPVHIHMHDGNNDVISTDNDANKTEQEQHVHLHMHVQTDMCNSNRLTDEYEFAKCQVLPNMNFEGDNDIRGLVTLRQKKDQAVVISINLKGFNSTKQNGSALHGFHIHSYGDLKDSCNSLGPHYNPGGVSYAGKHAPSRHVGDLRNIVADINGEVNFEMEDSKISLFGSHSIIGRSIVIHENADDLGNGENSDTSGNAGSRIACCVIVRSQKG